MTNECSSENASFKGKLIERADDKMPSGGGIAIDFALECCTCHKRAALDKLDGVWVIKLSSLLDVTVYCQDCFEAIQDDHYDEDE